PNVAFVPRPQLPPGADPSRGIAGRGRRFLRRRHGHGRGPGAARQSSRAARADPGAVPARGRSVTAARLSRPHAVPGLACVHGAVLPDDAGRRRVRAGVRLAAADAALLDPAAVGANAAVDAQGAVPSRLHGRGPRAPAARAFYLDVEARLDLGHARADDPRAAGIVDRQAGADLD